MHQFERLADGVVESVRGYVLRALSLSQQAALAAQI